VGSIQNILYGLLVLWGVITAVLICVMIYKSTLETREEDQLFLDSAENHMAAEQRLIVQRIEKLRRPVTALMVVSGALLAVIAAIWVYQGFQNF
jgi:Tfp pilus assembly protein PilN